jgi:transposase InsO family protein
MPAKRELTMRQIRQMLRLARDGVSARIRDKPIAPASPWQNGFAERLIGSIRRECLDHIIVLGGASAPHSEILRPIL